MWSVPQQDKKEAPAAILWYHGRSMVVLWCPQGTPRAARGVLDRWNWLALERISRMRFRLTVKCGTTARDRERRWERRRKSCRSTSATKGGALSRELVSENEIGTHPCRMDLKSLMQP